MRIVALLIGCRERALPPIVAEPPWIEPAPALAPMTPALRVATRQPTVLSVQIEGAQATRTITWPTPRTQHRVPLLGFRSGKYTLTPSLWHGETTVELEPIKLVIDDPPEGFPARTLHVAVQSEIEPGFNFMVVVNKEAQRGFITALDGEGEPVYVVEVSADAMSPVITASGEVAVVDGYDISFRSMQGELLRRFTHAPTEPVDIAVPYEDFHHDLVVMPEGDLFALSYRHLEVPEYPVAYGKPTTYAPAAIRDDLLVHLAPDGTVLDELSTAELLDPRRISYSSLQASPSGVLDWIHVNALQYDPEADELTFSARHQDAVVQVSRTGELQWILSHPGGWSEELAPFLLSATQPLVWFTHQHGTELDFAPGPDGTLRLRMFDNGNHDRSSPYYASGETENYSRLFEVAIDEAAMTFAPVLDLRHAPGSQPLYAGFLGNATRLPVTDNRLATWGPRGRIVAFDLGGEAVWDLAFEEGWRVNRSTWLPTLYPPGISDTTR